MSWEDILKEHPMERKKRLKTEKKQARKETERRDKNNCKCPKLSDGSYDLSKPCYCGKFDQAEEGSNDELISGKFFNQ